MSDCELMGMESELLFEQASAIDCTDVSGDRMLDVCDHHRCGGVDLTYRCWRELPSRGPRSQRSVVPFFSLFLSIDTNRSNVCVLNVIYQD